MAAASKVCSVCRSTYRGSYTTHAATRTHQANARRGSDSTKLARSEGGSRRAARARAARQATRSLDTWLRDNTVRVRTYVRRRPNDGPRRTVKVVRHYRGKPDVWTEVRKVGDTFYRVVFSNKTGAALSLRPTRRRP